jgi:hypothetical protein
VIKLLKLTMPADGVNIRQLNRELVAQGLVYATMTSVRQFDNDGVLILGADGKPIPQNETLYAKEVAEADEAAVKTVAVAHVAEDDTLPNPLQTEYDAATTDSEKLAILAKHNGLQ